LQSEEQNNSWDDRLRGLHPAGRVAELGSLGGSYDFVEATPTPTPPGREGQNKRGPLTQGVGSKTRLFPGLISHRPYRTSVCAGARIYDA